MRRRKQKNQTFGYTEPVPEPSTVTGFKKGTDYQPAPAHHVEIEVPEALAGTPRPKQSLADELVTRAEQTRARLNVDEHNIGSMYVGDAILALTERLTELDR